MITYAPSKPEVWRLPLFEEQQPAVKVRAPATGYVVPPAHAAWVADKLRVHGIRFNTVAADVDLATETFRADKKDFAKGPYEGRQRLDVKGAWRAERRRIPAGALLVPIAQPLAPLVLHLFEPQAPDSLLSWGFFNAHFEAKEYMESYVAEQVAAQMLADPQVKAAFTAELARDPDLAKNPRRRLEFFYRRHPSWDERLDLYPIYKY